SRRNVLPGTSILPRDARPTPVRPLTGTPTSRGSTPLSKKVKTDEFSGVVAGWTDPAVVTLAARLSAGSAAAMGAARRCHRDWLACGSGGARAAAADRCAVVGGAGGGLWGSHPVAACGTDAVCWCAVVEVVAGGLWVAHPVAACGTDGVVRGTARSAARFRSGVRERPAAWRPGGGRSGCRAAAGSGRLRAGGVADPGACT